MLPVLLLFDKVYTKYTYIYEVHLCLITPQGSCRRFPREIYVQDTSRKRNGGLPKGGKGGGKARAYSSFPATEDCLALNFSVCVRTICTIDGPSEEGMYVVSLLAGTNVTDVVESGRCSVKIATDLEKLAGKKKERPFASFFPPNIFNPNRAELTSPHENIKGSLSLESDPSGFGGGGGYTLKFTPNKGDIIGCCLDLPC